MYYSDLVAEAVQAVFAPGARVTADGVLVIVEPLDGSPAFTLFALWDGWREGKYSLVWRDPAQASEYHRQLVGAAVAQALTLAREGYLRAILGAVEELDREAQDKADEDLRAERREAGLLACGCAPYRCDCPYEFDVACGWCGDTGPCGCQP